MSQGEGGKPNASIHTPPLFSPVRPKDQKVSDPVYGGSFGVPDKRSTTSSVKGATIAPPNNERTLEGIAWDFMASTIKKLRS